MKKMRRMIPAFAMLMVAAIMLSTASYAWFTMNDVVTASGMQVQAKASGNLIISNDPLTAADSAIEVEVTNTDKVNLTPITYEASEWKYATKDTQIDPLYGDVVGGTLTVYDGDTGVGNYFAEYVVYLATAGDPLEKCDVKVKINGLSGVDQTIAPAYTIAFWLVEQGVDGSWADPDFNTPVAVLNYKDGQTAAVDITDDAERVTIPSNMEAGVDSRVGTKVIMRIYVDGALKTGETKTVNTTKILTAFDPSATWGTLKATYADKVYYNGAPVTAEEVATWGDDKVMDGYTYWEGNWNTAEHPVHYVNNTTVPTGSTTFEVEFSVTANPTNP